MRHVTLPLLVVLATCGLAVTDTACARKSKTPVTSGIKQLRMSPEELRIRVRALVRPTLGMVEETADEIRAGATNPAERRGTLVWKIETTSTLLSALLRDDPVLALADAWGFAVQAEHHLARPETISRYGGSATRAGVAMKQIQEEFREFVDRLDAGFTGQQFERGVCEWADRHPIEGAIYRRPAMDSEVAGELAAASGGGVFAAVGSLEETTAAVLTRIDLYTMYLPRLARWEAELAVDDLARGVDPAGLMSEVARATSAADRMAAVAEAVPDVAARERAAVLEALHAERIAAFVDLEGERRAAFDSIRQERISTLAEVEAITQRLADRSGGALHAATHAEIEELVRSVEAMRERLIDDAEASLIVVVDHAFVRGLQMLVIAAVVAFGGLFVLARLRRPT